MWCDLLHSARTSNVQQAAFCTRCNCAAVDCGKPASAELQQSVLDVTSARTRRIVTSVPIRRRIWWHLRCRSRLRSLLTRCMHVSWTADCLNEGRGCGRQWAVQSWSTDSDWTVQIVQFGKIRIYDVHLQFAHTHCSFLSVSKFRPIWACNLPLLRHPRSTYRFYVVRKECFVASCLRDLFENVDIKHSWFHCKTPFYVQLQLCLI